MKNIRYPVVAVAALLLGIIISWLISDAQPVKLEAGTWFGDQAQNLPDFQLTDHNNNLLNKQQLEGKWSLIFFGYTHCPDICPTTLQTMANMMQSIDDSDVKDAIRVIFVSVDSARDTPDLLKTYVQYFDTDFVGASAETAELRKLTRALGISFEIEKNSKNPLIYDVSHSAAVILLNPSVQYAGVFSAPHNEIALASDLTSLVERY